MGWMEAGCRPPSWEMSNRTLGMVDGALPIRPIPFCETDNGGVEVGGDLCYLKMLWAGGMQSGGGIFLRIRAAYL